MDHGFVGVVGESGGSHACVNAFMSKGKPYKCAIVAAMRKSLICIQSLLKNPEKTLIPA